MQILEKLRARTSSTRGVGRAGGTAGAGGAPGTGAGAGPFGDFHGSAPRGRPEEIEEAALRPLDGSWARASRYNRRARVLSVAPLTTTGTVQVAFEVADGEPFDFEPGNFIGVECHIDGMGLRRSPYCIASPPGGGGTFELLVRVVANGPVARYLGALTVGDEIAFRGPTGRSMVPRFLSDDMVLIATGVGIGPFLSLATHLLEQGARSRIRLFWGLRQVEDLCLTDRLDDLVSRFDNFTYQISLSEPLEHWTGLRGRVTESVPELLDSLGSTHFLLCGNGAMGAEFTAALSEMGVDLRWIHDEPFFNRRHRADPDVVAGICRRFQGGESFSTLLANGGQLFATKVTGKSHLSEPQGPGRAAADECGRRFW